MQSFSSFIFDSYSYDPASGRIELRYSLDDEVHFTETIHCPSQSSKLKAQSSLEAALHALHLIGGISYFKTCCPKTIDVRTNSLSETQAKFWSTVYENGLGEFAFKNKLNLWGKILFPSTPNPQRYQQPGISNHELVTRNPKPVTRNLLVPIGGGKDSIVTIEQLRKEGTNITLLRMGRHPYIDRLVEEMQLPCITVERTLSPELFQLNKEGALNGHIPITAYLTFLCVVIAEIYGLDGFVLSNERSASEGNVEHFGRTINHQWSKSAEAETLLREYIQHCIDPEISYLNPLREMSELEIVEAFTRYPQYFPLFTSCNRNWTIGPKMHSEETKKRRNEQTSRWCGSCPKCAFAFLLLAAYLPKAKVIGIFGKDLFEDPSLLPLFKQLLGIEGFKPFECVGTIEESQEAVAMIRKRGEFDDSPVLLYL